LLPSQCIHCVQLICIYIRGTRRRPVQKIRLISLIGTIGDGL
jgi:hypothetical protein